jgi:hypothetical protein
VVKKAHKNNLLPSKQTIDDGIYIDFEGFAPNRHRRNIPPSLIGIYSPSDDFFHQIVFNSKLKRAVEDWDVGYPVIFNSKMEDVLSELVGEARKKRPLFAFSEYEFLIIDKAIGEKRSIENRYRNVNLIAQQYFKDKHPGKPVPNTLSKVAERLKLDTNDKVKDHSITACIKIVKDACKTRETWENRDKKTRDSWDTLLNHNKWDCEIMHKALRKFLCHVQ